MASAPMATPCFEIAGEAGGDEHGGGVEQNDVAARAGNAGEHVIEQRFVGGHIAAGELIDCGAGKAGHLRRDARGFELRFAGLRLLDARDDGLACGGELVNSIGAVDHEGAPGSERRERAADEQNAAGSENANDLSARVGRIGERTNEVEDGAEAERAAQRSESLHGRVIKRREEKDEAGFAETFDGQLWRELDGHAESLKNIGSAAARGDGAIAVLGNAGAGGCGNERGSAGDVEGLRTAAAGADTVDEFSRSASVNGMGTECRRMTSTKPASSGACSPRVARTASRAAVSTSGTPPARISSST